MTTLPALAKRLSSTLVAAIILTVLEYDFVLAQAQSTSAFSIYCTSNLDGTGACNRIDNNQPVECEMIPGGVINCTENNQNPIQCIIYSGVIGSQAYFYCTHRTDPGVNKNRLNLPRFRQPAPTNKPAGNDMTNPSNNLTNGADRPTSPTQGFGDPLINVFD